MRLGVLGGGGIATTVIQAVHDGALPGVEIVGVAGRRAPVSERVARAAAIAGTSVLTAEGLRSREMDWLLEAAGVQAAIEYVPSFLRLGRNVVLMSVGAAIDPAVEFLARDRPRGYGILAIPSGAVGGLDVIRSMNSLGGLKTVEITSTKAPKGLIGAPYLLEHDIKIAGEAPQVVFRGTARQAIVGFPANTNVSVALSLAGLGPDRTMVEIIADPTTSVTVHQIRASGVAGEVNVRIAAPPHPENPRTSYLAALSAVAAIRAQI